MDARPPVVRPPGPATLRHTRLEAGVRDLDARARRRLRAAAAEVLGCMQELAARGQNPLSAVIGNRRQPLAWEHYPAGDCRDRTNGCSWYYHCHDRSPAGSGEHGHFHVFVHAGDGASTHLVALAVDAQGWPRRLFTTNRWVTDERWRPARAVLHLALRLRRLQTRRNRLLSRWLAATLELFRPQLSALLTLRDRRVAAWLANGRGGSLYEDRRIHVLSACAISLERQIACIEPA